MKKLYKTSMVLLLLIFSLAISLLPGCSSQEPAAREILADYLGYIQSRNYAEAYRLLSDFDKQHIPEDEFIDWRSAVDQISEKKSFDTDKNVDRLKNFEYMGTRFSDAYGFDVHWEQVLLQTDIELTDYDQDTFKIMVVKENDELKIALLILNIGERISHYTQKSADSR